MFKKALIFPALLTFFFLPAPQAQAMDVNVPLAVVDGNGDPIPNAVIYAFRFTATGPDASDSGVFPTLTDGTTVADLVQGAEYHVVATTNNVGPTLRNQIFDPSHLVFIAQSGMSTQTITLDGGALTNRGTINITVTNATPDSLVFGNVRKKSNQGDVAMGACETNGGGTCVLELLNVPAASGGTYDAGVFDPAANSGQGQGNGADVSSTLAANQSVGVAIDVSAGLPPDFSAGDANQSIDEENQGGSQGASVIGVVTSTNSTSETIPFGHVTLQNDQGQEVAFSPISRNGRFEFFNLTQGATYFVEATGGCRFNGTCYDGFRSTGNLSNPAMPISPNDFVFNVSTPPLIHRIQLPQAAAGTAQLGVYVRDTMGRLIPGAHINVRGDGSPWHANTSVAICNGQSFEQGVNISSPAFTQVNTQAATGYALLTGLRSGNYIVDVWTPFSQQGSVYNGGADGMFSYHVQERGCSSDSMDDIRLTVEPSDQVNLYNTTGTVVQANISSITVVVQTSNDTSGTISGVFTFPEVVDLSTSPITLIMRNCGENGCTGNFDVIGDTEAPSNRFSYTIQVASSTNGMEAFYFPEFISRYWGPILAGGDAFQIFFNGTNSVTRNYEFAPAGRVFGSVFKPDGSIFRPGPQSAGGFISGDVEARGLNVGSYGRSEIQTDGTYTIGGLLPGEYELIPRIHGGGGTTLTGREPSEKVTIIANNDIQKDVAFEEGELLLVQSDTTTLPSLIQEIPPGEDIFEGEIWSAIRLNAGTPFNADNLTAILDGRLSRNQEFEIVPAGNGPCGSGWGGGWCPNYVPTNEIYDIYMIRQGDIYVTQASQSIYPYFTIVDSTKNVIVNSNQRSNPTINFHGQSVMPVRVDFDVSGLGDGVVVRGDVTATNIFRRADFDSFGGNFERFLKFIPVVALYNSNRELVAAGMVVPPPAVLECDGEQNCAGDQIEQAVTSNDFDAFIQAFSGLQFSYEIRGVPQNQTYTMVGTTPNYPPFVTTVEVGGNGTTETVDINWDDAVGAGGTITGVVQSSGTSTAIPNARITIQARGIKERALTANASGQFTEEGLGVGAYTVTASADGFAPQALLVNVTGNDSFQANFDLATASGVITGTVRELVLTSLGPIKRPVKNALVLAHDDTVNGTNLDRPLPLYKVLTSSVGVYSLSGLIVNNTYDISVLAPGRYVERVSTVSLGTTVTLDIDMEQKPLEVQVLARKNSPNYEFRILNPNNFEDGSVFYGENTQSFSTATATDISNTFQNLPDGTLIGTIPLSALTDGVEYLLRIIAVPRTGDNNVTKDLVFGLDIENNNDDPIDDAITGNNTVGANGRAGNEIPFDPAGGRQSIIIIPPGAVEHAGNADDIPNLVAGENSGTGASSQFSISNVTQVSSRFTLNFSSVNFTGRHIEFCFEYNAASVGGNLDNLGLYHVVNGQNTLISGQVTVDPVTSVACVRTNPTNLSGFVSSGLRVAGAENKEPTMAALWDGRQFTRNPKALASGSGSFVVGLNVTTSSVASNGYKQYNYPNPFNLKNKVVTRRNAAQDTIRGTYIVVAPTGSGTVNVNVRIYSLAGDLVREIQGQAAAGNYNYFHWDGRNTAGNDVASGVYFGVVDGPGAPDEKPIKLVVVK